MRYILDSGLPVDASIPEAVPGLKSPDPVKKQEHLAALHLKRMVTIPMKARTELGYPAHGWTVAYANPFIHGSFLNWYHDDPTYHRTEERAAETKALYKAFGNFVYIEK